MVVLMSISTWDQIEEFRSGRETYIVPLYCIDITFTSRKLYEPKHFPKAVVLKIFDKYFGKFDDRDSHEVKRLCG